MNSTERRLLHHLEAAARSGARVGTQADIAAELGTSQGKISDAMQGLRDAGHVAHHKKPHGYLVVSLGKIAATHYHHRTRGENDARTKRSCMSCNKPFLSEGIHNRLCADCIKRSRNMPNACTAGGGCGRRVTL